MDARTGNGYGTSVEVMVQDTLEATTGAGAVCGSIRVTRSDQRHGLQSSYMARGGVKQQAEDGGLTICMTGQCSMSGTMWENPMSRKSMMR